MDAGQYVTYEKLERHQNIFVSEFATDFDETVIDNSVGLGVIAKPFDLVSCLVN